MEKCMTLMKKPARRLLALALALVLLVGSLPLV